MNQFFVTVHSGKRNAVINTVLADDGFMAAFLVCCDLESCGQMNLGERPYIRYDTRKDTYYVNGVPVQILRKP